MERVGRPKYLTVRWNFACWSSQFNNHGGTPTQAHGVRYGLACNNSFASASSTTDSVLASHANGRQSWFETYPRNPGVIDRWAVSAGATQVFRDRTQSRKFCMCPGEANTCFGPRLKLAASNRLSDARSLPLLTCSQPSSPNHVVPISWALEIEVCSPSG